MHPIALRPKLVKAKASGYVMRAQPYLFRQGDRHPWKHLMEYAEEISILPAVQPNDEALAYR
jgi:cyclohexanone monooxygenase